MSREHFASFVQSIMVAPRKFHLVRSQYPIWKSRLLNFFPRSLELSNDNPGQAVLPPRVCGQNKETTKWQLPNLFGSMLVTNRVLPLGFSSMETPSNLLSSDVVIRYLHWPHIEVYSYISMFGKHKGYLWSQISIYKRALFIIKRALLILSKKIEGVWGRCPCAPWFLSPC